jgi:hypothetical protein
VLAYGTSQAARKNSDYIREREGHDFHDLRQRSILRLILGGAAVDRCDEQHISNVGSSRCGDTAARKILFPQPPSPKHQTYSRSNSCQ